MGLMIRAVGLNATQKCTKYGGFMSHHSHEDLKGVFWGLFAFVLVLLIIASRLYNKSEDKRQQVTYTHEPHLLPSANLLIEVCLKLRQNQRSHGRT